MGPCGVWGVARAQGLITEQGRPVWPASSAKTARISRWRNRAEASGVRGGRSSADRRAEQRAGSEGHPALIAFAREVSVRAWSGRFDPIPPAGVSPSPRPAESRFRPLVGVQEFQRKLWVAAKRSPGRRFHAVFDRICRSDVLREAWRRVQKNKGAAGSMLRRWRRWRSTGRSGCWPSCSVTFKGGAIAHCRSAGCDPQAQGWCAATWHPDRKGSDRPAGCTDGA